jgi:3-phosphoshikimate 1-carboxyvinyltransferase
MHYPKALTLTPRQGAVGVVQLPGSKSISNRMLLLAALAKGNTTLSGLLDSDDTRVMIDSLQKLGLLITPGSEQTTIVQGANGVFPVSGSRDAPLQLFIGNSGLTIRTLVPAIAASLSVTGGCVEIAGVPRMHERPIGDLVEGLRAIGASIDYLETPGFPPLRINGVPLAPCDQILVKGSTSSQFLTGLLQAAPLLATRWQRPVVLAVQGELISKPYVEITRATLAKFGVQVMPHRKPALSEDRQSGSPAIAAADIGADSKIKADPKDAAISESFVIVPQTITSPGALSVEGDASSASYFLAAGLLGGGPVRVEGAGRDSVQGDVRFADALEKMGATISWGPDWIEASNPARQVRGVDLDCNAIPDAAMTLAVCALFADQPTTLRNIGSWRVKETDRIAAMANECRTLGARVEEGADWIRVFPLAPPNNGTPPAAIHTYDDHRVAMCFSLASFGSTPVQILDPGCVAKTFPDYFEVFSDLCAQAVPVIAIDGPTASGKGTVASLVAQQLGFAYLDSGALYRLAALAATLAGVDSADEQALTSVATDMQIEFKGQVILLAGQDVTEAIRAEEIGLLASKIAVYPGLRRALLLRQRDFARLPGLVADGRDMGTVVFPHAELKLFLTATPLARAERRYNQLIAKGFSCNLDSLSADLAARDARDASRLVAPLKPARGATVLDSTCLSINQSVQSVLNAWNSKAAHRAL